MPKFTKAKLKSSVSKFLVAHNTGSQSVDCFIHHAKLYIKATRKGLLLYHTSGVNRGSATVNIRVSALDPKPPLGPYHIVPTQLKNFNLLFASFGYEVNPKGEFQVCDILDAHANAIHKLRTLGFLSQENAAALARTSPADYTTY